MKIKLLALISAMLLLSGCGEVALQKDAQPTPVPTQSAENLEVGKKSEEKVDGGVKLTVENKDDKNSDNIKTESYYMFKDDVLISIRNEITYNTEEAAKKNEELFKTKPQSCVDVSREGKVVIYYASVSAMEFMKDMKKADVKSMGGDIGAEIEDF